MMSALDCRVVRDARDIADAQRLRWRVYGEEECLLPRSACTRGRDIDPRDDDPDTIHLMVRADGEPVGSVRLLPARPAANDNMGHRLGLPLESTFAFSLPAVSIVAAEVTRYCVLRCPRGTGVAAALFRELRAESDRRGITHWFAAANMQTDHPEEADLAYRLVRARRLLDDEFRSVPRQPPPGQTRRRRRCYSEAQLRRAEGGELSGLPIPRTVALFALGMGARYLGRPGYDVRHDVFSLPLVCRVKQTLGTGPGQLGVPGGRHHHHESGLPHGSERR
jgi:hypothetical protein